MANPDGKKFLKRTVEEASHINCNPCLNDSKTNTAKYYCQDCTDYMCDSCIVTHNKLMRKHKILSGRRLPMESISKPRAGKPRTSSGVSCVCSNGTDVEFHCEIHDDVICSACKNKDHTTCKVFCIYRKSYETSIRSLDSALKMTTVLKDRVEKLQSDKTAEQETCAQLKEKCIENIHSFRKALNSWLDRLEQNTLKRIEEGEGFRSIKSNMSSLAKTMHEVDECYKVLETDKKHGSKEKMFATSVKIIRKLKKHENSIVAMEKESALNDLVFQKNQKLEKIMADVQSLGAVTELFRVAETVNTNSSEPKDIEKIGFLDMKFQAARKMDISIPEDKSTPIVTDCAFMPDGRLVLCDYRNMRIKLLSFSFAVCDSLYMPDVVKNNLYSTAAWGVSVVDKCNVVVTLPNVERLQFIQVSPTFSLGRTILVDKLKPCWGIRVVDKQIYTTCHQGLDRNSGEVRVYDMNGVERKRIGVNQDRSFMFRWPKYLAVNRLADKIYVTDAGRNRVTCLKSDGHVVFEHIDRNLIWPRGLCVDTSDNVTVCGEKSHNLHIITSEGKWHKSFLSPENCLKSPFSIAVREIDGRIVIGGEDRNILVHSVTG